MIDSTILESELMIDSTILESEEDSRDLVYCSVI